MGWWITEQFKRYGPEMILDVLEERIVLDATVDQGAQQDQTHVTAEATTQGDHAVATGGTETLHNDTSTEGLHVILVSSDVQNIEAIKQAKLADATVIVFDAQTEGLDAINAKLSELVEQSGKKISILAVLGHGSDGVVEIGSDHISEGNFVKFASALQSLGGNLTKDAQIEFFGCSVAAGTSGQALIHDIAELTHATVFASTNDTGWEEGNDWNLEYSSQDSALMVQVLDTAALALTDVTLVFSNTPFSWTDDPTQYAISWGDIDTLDPSGTAGYPDDDDGYGHAEYWTFIVPTGGGYVSFGMQTIHPQSQDDTAFLDSLLRLTTATTGMVYVDDWVGPGNVDLDGDGNYDVNVWDARLVDIYLPAGTYTLECTHYIWTGSVSFRNTGAYTLYSSFRADLSSEFTPLTMTYDTVHNHLNNEVVSRPVLDVTKPVGFDTYAYDVSDSFGRPPTNTISYRLVSTSPGFLDSITIDANTGIITFTEEATPVAGTVTVTVEAYYGSLVSDQQVFTFNAIQTYDLPSAESARYWVEQNGSISFWVIGYDPDLHDNSLVRFTWDSDYGVQHGTLTTDASTLYHDANGYYYQRFTYTPTSGYYGLDGFQFTFETQGGTTWRAFTAGPDSQGRSVGVSPTTDSYNTYVVEFADLNNDGFLDIVEGNYGTLNRYYLNDGNGNYRVSHALGTDTSNTTCIAVGDVNRDGWVDIVAGNYNQSDMVYLNLGTDGSGTWLGFGAGSAISGTDTGQEYAVVLGDLNEDGYLDLVRGNYNILDSVHLNLGAGTFDSGNTISSTVTGYTRALALGDIDRDGHLDLVVGKYASSTDMLFLGNGNGTFGTGTALPGTIGDRTTSIALGDVNEDGWLDIVTGNYASGSSNNSYRTKLYLNSGSGTFTTQTSVGGSNYNAYDIELGDVDRDGDVDILLGVYGSRSVYWLNNGSGGFGTGNGTQITSVSASTRSIAVGDVDGDGDLDVLYGISNSLDRIMINQGFNTGTGTYHTTAPGIVELNVSLLAYPSFQADNSLNPSGIYQDGLGLGWQWNDENPLSFASTFAIVDNRSTTVALTSVYDYYDTAITGVTTYELQLSFGLPVSIMDVEASSGEQIALLLGNQAHHATLWQDVTLPQDATLTGVDLQWRMAYQNDYYYLDSTAPFDSTYQYIAVYVYTPDAEGNRPAGTEALWITTNGRDAGVVRSLQDYTIHLPASLVPTTGSRTIRVEFELVAENWFFEVAIDNFVLIPVTEATGSAQPPVITETAATTEALVTESTTSTTENLLTTTTVTSSPEMSVVSAAEEVTVSTPLSAPTTSTLSPVTASEPLSASSVSVVLEEIPAPVLVATVSTAVPETASTVSSTAGSAALLMTPPPALPSTGSPVLVESASAPLFTVTGSAALGSVSLTASPTTLLSGGTSMSFSTTTSDMQALDDLGFSAFLFDAVRPVPGSAGPDSGLAWDVGIPGEETVTLVADDESSGLESPLALDDADGLGDGDPTAMALAHDHAPGHAHVSDQWREHFDPRVGLVLDPAQISALHVLQVQASAGGVHAQDTIKGMDERLVMGEALVFDLDAVRLYDL